MRISQVAFPATLGVLVAVSSGASPHYSYVGKPDDQVYFGHIAYCEHRGDEGDPKIVRDEQKAAERAVVNAPLLPGDTIATGAGRRCEAQFDTGTVVRLDGATKLRIETILAPALTRDAGVTNFLLATGRIEIQYRHYAKNEVFQVLTPTAAVKLSDRAVVTISLEDDGSTTVEPRSGSAQVLFERQGGGARRRTVDAGQRYVFGSGHGGGEKAPSESAAVLDFRGWNEVRNSESYKAASLSSEGTTTLHGAPPAVVEFASRAQGFGRWVSSDIYGAVWRPYDNDRAGWRPYLEGQWAPVQGDLFWIADEPWGWVPYHLGYWTSLRGYGWVWVPGSWFAPAWVHWSPNDALWGWRPMDVWDFYGDDSLAWYGGDGGGSTTSPAPRPPEHAVPRRPAPPSPGTPVLPPDRPRPREVQMIARRMAKAPDESLSRLRSEAAVVRRSTVMPSGDTQPLKGAVEARSEPATPDTNVVANPKPSEAQKEATASSSVTYTPLVPAEVAFGIFPRARFRDWNPDAPFAHAMGGRLYYSSRNNAVQCVSCASPLLRPGAGSYGSTGSASTSGSGSPTSTSGGAAAAPAASAGAGQSGGGRDGTFAGGNVRRDN
jgi:hypothetical protein